MNSPSTRAAGGAPAPQSGGWPRSLFLLLSILLLALALRLYGNAYSLWYDEIASTRFAAEPWRLLWSDWMIDETNPPLYYSLLKLWIGLVGDSDAQIRGLSALIGLGGIACSWQVGRNLAGLSCAAMAALLVAVSQQHIFYSEMARGYGLGHAATLLALVGLTDLARAEAGGSAAARRRALATYAIGAIVAVYCHTTLVLVPLLANLWYLARVWGDWQRRGAIAPSFRGWLIANLVVLGSWSWWARLTWLQSTQMGSNIGWIQQPSLPYAVRMTLESYVPWGIGPASGLAAVLFAGLFAWGAWKTRATTRARGLDAVVLVAIAAPVVLFVISLVRPVFLPRTVYFAAGPFLVGVAVGLTALPRRLVAIGLALCLLLEGAASIAWFGQREIEPWRAVARAVSAPGSPPILVVKGAGPAFALQRYCAVPGCGKQVWVLPSPQVDHWSDGMARAPMTSPAELQRLLSCAPAALALRWGADDPSAVLRAAGGQSGAVATWGPGGSLGLARWAGFARDPARCFAR